MAKNIILLLFVPDYEFIESNSISGLETPKRILMKGKKIKQTKKQQQTNKQNKNKTKTKQKKQKHG